MASAFLSGLKIAVTRPREQASGLAQGIQRIGGKPLLFPLLEITPVGDTQALRELVQQIATYDLLVFISPNAVKYGMAALGGLPSAVRVAAVGQGSARALRELGISGVIAPGGCFDSEALLALAELQNVAGKRIAILRGDSGRELLGDTLIQRGADLQYIPCYQRSKSNLDIAGLLDAAPDVISVTSGEALAHLWEMADESGRKRLADTPLFVPHVRIAQAAQERGWRQVIVTGSGDDGLLEGLVAWKQAKKRQMP